MLAILTSPFGLIGVSGLLFNNVAYLRWGCKGRWRRALGGGVLMLAVEIGWFLAVAAVCK